MTNNFRNNRAFTLIELIVVIAILGILVLLALPKFLGHTEDARLVQIQNDVKVVENALEIELLDDPDYITNKGWKPVSLETMNGYVEAGSLFDSKGKVDEELTGGEFYLIKDELAKTKLNGKFIAEKGGKIYYYEEGLNVDGNDGENVYLATDDDFEWVAKSDGDTYFNSAGEKGYFRYIGTGQEIIEIPHVIQGVEMTSYYQMFDRTGKDVKKVISTNEKITDMRWMFYYSQVTELDLSSFDTSNVTSMTRMFQNSKATKITFGDKFDTSQVTDMRWMFQNSKANTITFGDKFDTSQVTDMSNMFENSKATTLDLSSFDTSNVTDMSNMFENSKATELDLSSFDTSNVTSMRWMFADSQATSLDLSSFDTSNVTDMRWMFNGSQATSLDLSSFDTSKVIYIGYMFENSKATKGYARTQADADKFNRSSNNRPSGLTFCVKGTEGCN